MRTISYQVLVPAGVRLDPDALSAHVTRWSVRLSSSSYALYPEDETVLRGTTSVRRARALAADYLLLVLALCELELLFPGVEARLSDDEGVLTGVRPHELVPADLRRTLERIEIREAERALGRAFLRLANRKERRERAGDQPVR
ncbi:MAG: hypothetical protein ACOZQL_27255 [Myxococcota bacterium]